MPPCHRDRPQRIGDRRAAFARSFWSQVFLQQRANKALGLCVRLASLYQHTGIDFELYRKFDLFQDLCAAIGSIIEVF